MYYICKLITTFAFYKVALFYTLQLFMHDSTKIQLFPENCIVRLSFKSKNDNFRLQNSTLMKEI